MKTITVAGISIKESAKERLTYEQLFEQAKNSAHWLRVKDADKKIDAELRKHGFKPVKKAAKSVKADKQAES